MQSAVATRVAVFRLERDLILAGMLDHARVEALCVVRAALGVILDFMPPQTDKVVAMGDTTIARTISDMLNR